MEPDGGADQTEVKVRFVTTDDEFQLPENKRQLVVPAGI